MPPERRKFDQIYSQQEAEIAAKEQAFIDQVAADKKRREEYQQFLEELAKTAKTRAAELLAQDARYKAIVSFVDDPEIEYALEAIGRELHPTQEVVKKRTFRPPLVTQEPIPIRLFKTYPKLSRDCFIEHNMRQHHFRDQLMNLTYDGLDEMILKLIEKAFTESGYAGEVFVNSQDYDGEGNGYQTVEQHEGNEEPLSGSAGIRWQNNEISVSFGFGRRNFLTQGDALAYLANKLREYKAKQQREQERKAKYGY